VVDILQTPTSVRVIGENPLVRWRRSDVFLHLSWYLHTLVLLSLLRIRDDTPIDKSFSIEPQIFHDQLDILTWHNPLHY